MNISNKERDTRKLLIYTSATLLTITISILFVTIWMDGLDIGTNNLRVAMLQTALLLLAGSIISALCIPPKGQ